MSYINKWMRIITVILALSIGWDLTAQQGRPRGGRFWGRDTRPNRAMILPPTMRLGLLEVVNQIGGPEAKKILVETLDQCQSGLELRFLDQAFEKMELEKSERVELINRIVEKAKLLIQDPPHNSNEYLTRRSAEELFRLLVKHQDESFTNIAKSLILNPEGGLNRNALDYISRVKGKESVDIIYDIYLTSNLTNRWDKRSLTDSILKHVGDHPKSDQMFMDSYRNGLEAMENPNGDAGPFPQRELMQPLFSLVRGTDEASDAVLENRQQLLSSVKRETRDETTLKMIVRLDQQFNEWLDPNRDQDVSREFDFGRFFRGGQRGESPPAKRP